MTKKLYDYDIDENIELFLFIASADARLAKNGKKFLALTFQDKSGKMDGKFWDASDEDIESFTGGTIVHLKGKRELYQGNSQVRIFSMRPAGEDEPQDPYDFVESAPMSTQELMDYINETLYEITNPVMNQIVRQLLNKHHKAYFQAPAAKRLHHAFSGGLAYHTVSILNLAKAVVSQYDAVDPSLLYAGILLHDIGKVKELSGPLNTEYTLEGNLVGHIVLASEEITEVCKELAIDEENEDVILLKHVVLAHHGQLEYGSPVRPKILEAEILHALDDLDASITMISDALKRTEAGTFGERLFGMDNRSFYKKTESETTETTETKED